MNESLLADYLNEHAESQSAFARRAGVSESALSDWLRGRRNPDVTSAVAIERATDGAVPVESWVRQNDGRRNDIPKAAS